MPFQKGHKIRLGFHNSVEARKKISLALKGKKKPPRTADHSRKISEAKKGTLPWNTGKKWSDEIKLKIGKAAKGRRHSQQWKKMMRTTMTGRKLSKEWRDNISKSKQGAKSHFWKGGISSKNDILRESAKNTSWRQSVFERDDWTCRKYKIKGGILNAHHIFNFADFPSVRFAVANGITLSEKAHIQFHKKYGQTKNTAEQIIDFLTS